MTHKTNWARKTHKTLHQLTHKTHMTQWNYMALQDP